MILKTEGMLKFTRKNAIKFIERVIKENISNDLIIGMLNVLHPDNQCQIVEEEDDVTYVVVTYEELYRRCNNSLLIDFGLNPWYINEGGDPQNTIRLSWIQAIRFMSQHEYDGRCKKFS